MISSMPSTQATQVQVLGPTYNKCMNTQTHKENRKRILEYPLKSHTQKSPLGNELDENSDLPLEEVCQ